MKATSPIALFAASPSISTPALPTFTMSLPQFGDIGKEMKEMFSKGFDFDSIKLSMVSLQLGSMQYQGEQKMNKEGKMTGQLESK